MTFIVIIAFFCLLWVSLVANRIPETGRAGITTGKTINGTIVNQNKRADRCATMKLRAEDGRLCRVKLKSTEARPWIKGDTVQILVSEENEKKYRVLFNDYFRNNDERIRERIVQLLKSGVSTRLFAAKAVKYTAASAEEIAASALSAQRIFSFVTYMRALDLYAGFTLVLAIAAVCYIGAGELSFVQMLIPIVFVFLMLWMLYSLMTECTKILKEAKKK